MVRVQPAARTEQYLAEVLAEEYTAGQAAVQVVERIEVLFVEPTVERAEVQVAEQAELRAAEWRKSLKLKQKQRRQMP